MVSKLLYRHLIKQLNNLKPNSALGPKQKKISATDSQKTVAPQFDAYRIGRIDTYILRCALDKADELRMAGDDLVLVNSDKKLSRAAKKERLLTFDPETDNQIDLDSLINSP